MTHTTPPGHLKQQIRDGLTHPVFEMVLLTMILMSVGLLVAELWLDEGNPWFRVIEALGDGLTLAFAVELCIRGLVARSRRRFLRRFWIDILAILPAMRVFRLFRILRVLRVFRAGVILGRRLGPRSLFGASAGQLTSLVAISFALTVACARVIQWAEPGALSTFENALWYAMFSLVAGEPVGDPPVTEAGRAAALALMLGGLTVFGVFVGLVSADVGQRLSDGWGVSEMELEDLVDHVMVLGWNGSASTLLRELLLHDAQRPQSVVLITEHECPDDVPAELAASPRFFHLQGDYTRVEVLEHAGVLTARKAIVLTDQQSSRSDQDKDARVVLAALTMERMAPSIYTVVEVTSRDTVPLLRMANVEEIVVGDWYAGVIMGSAARNRGLVTMLEEVLTNARGNSFHSVELPASWDGISAAALHERLFREHHATLISVETGGARGLVVNPSHELTLATGDRIVVLAAGAPHL